MERHEKMCCYNVKVIALQIGQPCKAKANVCKAIYFTELFQQKNSRQFSIFSAFSRLIFFSCPADFEIPNKVMEFGIFHAFQQSQQKK